MELGISHLRKSVSILEAEYEESESPKVERQFVIANSNLARMLLHHDAYEEALDMFQSVVNLLADADESVGVLLRSQAQLGSGVCLFKLGQLEEAHGVMASRLFGAHPLATLWR